VQARKRGSYVCDCEGIDAWIGGSLIVFQLQVIVELCTGEVDCSVRWTVAIAERNQAEPRDEQGEGRQSDKSKRSY